jgi:hypothetical protein
LFENGEPAGYVRIVLPRDKRYESQIDALHNFYDEVIECHCWKFIGERSGIWRLTGSA